MQEALSKFFIIKSLIYLVGFSVLGYLLYLKRDHSSSQPGAEFAYSAGVNQACIDTRCFDLEIADDEQEREQGLMNRNSLPSQSGMLFVFDKPDIYSFWMKNTLIPLDMIWINSSGVIVDIQKAVPCVTEECKSYVPAVSGSYVLEINAGISDLLGIQTGTIIQFKQK